MSEVSLDSAPSIMIDVGNGGVDEIQINGSKAVSVENGVDGNQSAELDSYPEG